MWGAKPFSSTLMRRSLSASQFGSSPSPSEVARPMPVIQTSADPGYGDFVSVMGGGLLRETDAPGLGVHMHAQIRTGERDVAEGEGRVASQLAIDPYLGLGDRVTGAVVNQAGMDRQQFAGRDEAPHLGFLDRGQKRHPLELHQREQ